MANKNVKVIKNKKDKKFNFSKVTYFLKTFFSNEACKEFGVKHWISSIFIMLLAVFISVIPTLTTEATKTGSSSINNSYNDVFVETLYDFVNDDSIIDFEIKDHKMVALGEVNDSHVYTYERSGQRFDVLFFDTTVGSSFSEQVTLVTDNNPNIKSGIYFGSDQYQIAIYNDSSLIASSVGQYGHIEDIPSLKNYIKANTSSLTDILEIKDAYKNNFFVFLDNGYLDLRGTQVGINVGILLAINGGITLIAPLIMFLLSRGKNNPNSVLKYYQVMGASFLASLTPSILALIFGYLFSGQLQMAAVLYVMMYGLRLSWLAMKYLRTPID